MGENITDDLERQMGAQWTAMLGLMTQQGASRLEIMELTTATALVLLNTTADGLWPSGVVYPAEAEEGVLFTSTTAHLETLLDFIRGRKGAEVTEGTVEAETER